MDSLSLPQVVYQENMRVIAQIWVDGLLEREEHIGFDVLYRDYPHIMEKLRVRSSGVPAVVPKLQLDCHRSDGGIDGRLRRILTRLRSLCG